MGNKDKNKDQGDSGTSNRAIGRDITSPHNAHHTNHDLSWEREARDAALAKQVAEAIAREMAKAHTHYQALLSERSTAVLPTSLKMTSGTLGFKVMDPFDWTKDKKLSTRDGNCDQKKLDTPLRQWKVIHKRLKFHISTTGLTVKEWPKLNHGRTARHS